VRETGIVPTILWVFVSKITTLSNRRLRPEEEELFRKREELVEIKAFLGERELELADLCHQLASFEGQYLRQVGRLYAELDEWKARILESRAQRDSSMAATQEAEQAREQARQTYETAYGEASKTDHCVASPELKSLFREVAKRIHPDFATSAADLERRTRFMAEANRAFEKGDFDALRWILHEYEDSPDTVAGDGIGAELIRLIRQISLAKNRLEAIAKELAILNQSEIALLMKQTEEAEQVGRDLLSELARAVREQIARTKKEYDTITEEQTR